MASTRRSIGLLLGAVLLGTAACAPGGTAAGGASTPVATTSVQLPKSYRFEPAAIVVPAGATVTWTNDDNFTHSVRFLDGGLPGDARLMEPGASVSFTFEKPGTYRYDCSLHPKDMQGTVTVGS